jgi:hypothetical protein
VTGAFHTPSAARAVSQRDIATTQQINADPVDPIVRAFTWSAVNVTAGWYELTATINLPSFIYKSVAFYVQNGTNVSCIAAPPRPSPFLSIPSNPASSHSATSTASVSQSTGVPTVTPGPSKHKVNRGVMVGGAVGGVAALCGAIAAYLYLMRLRRRRNIPLLYTPVPPVLLRSSSPPPMRSKGSSSAPAPRAETKIRVPGPTAVVVTPEVQPPAVPVAAVAPSVPLPAAVDAPEVPLPTDQQRRRDLEVEERLRYLEEQLASVTQPPAYN